MITIINPNKNILNVTRQCIRFMTGKPVCEEIRKAKVWLLAKQFKGPARERDFKKREEVLVSLKHGEFLAEAMYWSVDPYMRAYAHNYKVNETMPGFQVAKIINSKCKGFKVGDIVTGQYGWRTLTIVNPKKLISSTVPVEDFTPLPLSLALSYAGLTGNTAFFGMTEIARPRKNHTVVISGAAGAVGSHAGQIAKLNGSTVIGICGDQSKCDWLTKELGFDYAINYKRQDIRKELKKITNGVDIYWDNVGGAISSQVINEMKQHGKVIVCGAISTYNHDFNWPPYAPEIQGFIYFKQLQIQGFLVNSFLDEWHLGVQQNLEMLKQGQLKYKEWIVEGFENIPRTFIDMMNGRNIGKAIVKNVDAFSKKGVGGFFCGKYLSKQSLNV